MRESQAQHLERRHRSMMDQYEVDVATLGGIIRNAEIRRSELTDISPTNHEIAQRIRERVWRRRAFSRGGRTR